MNKNLTENQTLEFKKSLAEKEEILETISAFGTTKGGKILVGIEENKDGTIKEITGIELKGKVIENLTNEIKQNTDPVIFPSIETKRIEGKNVLLIKIEESSLKPVFVKGRAYKRVGRSNLRLTTQEIRKLAKESGEKAYWDEQLCKEASLEDIDEEKVRWFVKEAKRQRGLKLSETSSIKDILIKLKLLKNKKLTNACMLLFSKEPKFLQSEVKGIRFSGNEPVKPYIDFQTIERNVFDLVDRAEEFVLRNIKKAIWLVPGQVQREEKYEYPPDALREAITNAIVHRDYESPSKVQVRVFDSKVEIWSPGLLPAEITVEDLKREHRSIPRNPLLFKQLFWVKYVEDVGGGTLDMIKQCKKWGIPEPEFRSITGAFVVVFRLPPSLENLEKLGLNERQIKAVEHVTKKGSITNQEYQNLNQISRYTASRDLMDLVKKGVLKSKGTGKRKLSYVLLLMQNASKTRQKTRQKNDENATDQVRRY